MIREGLILGVQQSNLADLYDRQLAQKAKSSVSVSAHPLHSEVQILPSGSDFPLLKL